ncbi:MAG: CDP-archaeol synthase [Patescibacteria group bacterium]
MLTLIKVIYLFLPAYCANMAPVFASSLKLPFGQPISIKYFGEHKTWRGFITGFFAALLVLYIQKYFKIDNISLLDYDQISIWLYAFVFGIGALTGDLVKSFFKRWFNKKPGVAWFPFDQVDFIVGAIIFLYPLYQIDLKTLLILLIITPILHIIANIIGYFLGLKSVWW